MRRRPIAAELPAGGPARAAVIAMLVAGGAVALGLPVLIVLFIAASLRG
jgi:hypothetical protein